MEQLYSTKGQETKDSPIKDLAQDSINYEGKNSHELLDCNNSECDTTHSSLIIDEEVCLIEQEDEKEGIMDPMAELIATLEDIDVEKVDDSYIKVHKFWKKVECL